MFWGYFVSNFLFHFVDISSIKFIFHFLFFSVFCPFSVYTHLSFVRWVLKSVFFLYSFRWSACFHAVSPVSVFLSTGPPMASMFLLCSPWLLVCISFATLFSLFFPLRVPLPAFLHFVLFNDISSSLKFAICCSAIWVLFLMNRDESIGNNKDFWLGADSAEATRYFSEKKMTKLAAVECKICHS